MGRKGRKTRWRALNIDTKPKLDNHYAKMVAESRSRKDEQSDSEESSSTNGVQKSYQHKSFYSKFTFSSQSTPTRRSYDVKSTRSSSTASETKVTFNEDEYTRITTPRQDVLFKKGYLNKPKIYQTQTSTGTSTNSTCNSTGNGTPDHHSADGTEGTDLEYESQFVFPNGFVDQNGIYYVNGYEPYSLVVYNAPICYPEYPRPKRYSTDSLAESTSPNNEETNHSGGELPPAVPDYSPVIVYPNVYYNDGYNQNGLGDKRTKKKRRKRVSMSKTGNDGTTSEYTDEEDEPQSEQAAQEVSNGCDNNSNETEIPQSVQSDDTCRETPTDDTGQKETVKFDPDAQEFVPKAYRQPFEHVQYVNIPPSFVPIPLIGEPLPPYPAPFLPPAIPLNFIPPSPKIIPNFVNVVPETNAAKPVEQEQNVGQQVNAEAAEPPKNKTDIDIAKIVSKLEQAAKEQRNFENKRQGFGRDGKFKGRYQNYRNNYRQVENYKSKPGFYKKQQEDRRKGFVKTNDPIQKISNGPSDEPTPNGHLPDTEETPKQEHNTTKALDDKIAKEEKIENYSDKLKAHKNERPVEKPQPPKTEPPQTVSKQPKPPSQWISVSSRKKRKNKAASDVEETEAAVEEEIPVDTNDDFESYDVSQLVDVVPPSETSPPVEIDTQKMEPAVVVEPEPAIEAPKEEIVEPVQNEPQKSRKPKKGTQKPLTKRIIITDAYETQEVEQKEPEPVKPVEPIEPPTPVKAEEPVPTERKLSSKKKKKKVPKSVSSSNTTINNLDDSYDFLLENSLLDDSEDRTNVEISLELDRMIQKGMYNSLEEKIKSFNVGSISDSFFHTLNLTAPPSLEKNNFFKATDFSSLVSKKRFEDIDLSKVKLPEPQPSTSKTGIFVENPQVKEILKDVCEELPKLEVPHIEAKRGKSNGKLKNKSKKREEEQKKPKEEIAKEEVKTLYPITQAVKEWMTKTRENTPEVEILKSPHTILKEVVLTNGHHSTDEDVVLWSLSRESSLDPDLLDCWDESDTVPAKKCDQTTPEVAGIDKEEEVEVYESKYGNNEDYLKIKAEIEEKTTNGKFPKHGNLPYRAICCSLM